MDRETLAKIAYHSTIQGSRSLPKWDHLMPVYQDGWRHTIDKILDAMTEPSKEMLDAAGEAALDGKTGYEVKHRLYEMHASPKVYWQAMLGVIKKTPTHEDAGAKDSASGGGETVKLNKEI